MRGKSRPQTAPGGALREKENEQIGGGVKTLARGGAPAGESTAGGTVVEETECGGAVPQRRAEPCGALVEENEDANPSAISAEQRTGPGHNSQMKSQKPMRTLKPSPKNP
jgi:hypothetical protein